MIDKDLSIFNLTGKQFLITGAASGIGRATSIILSKLGAKLILIDLNSAGLRETKLLCNQLVSTAVFDLIDTHGIKELLLGLTESYGLIDGFVHLAGVPYITPLKGISIGKLEEVMKINTIAGLELAKVFVQKRISGDGERAIVYISSIYGLVGSEASVGYAMSKAALHGITRSLAIELAPKRIRVNCIAPGFVKTPMMESTTALFNDERIKMLAELHPLGLGEQDDIGYACAFLLSDLSKWITGAIIPVDGGFTAR